MVARKGPEAADANEDPKVELLELVGQELTVLANEYRQDGFEEIANGFEGLVLRLKEAELEGNYFEDVKEFHRIFHVPPDSPIFLDAKKWSQRVRLINEEWSELTTAYAFGDEEKFADGLVDLTWVVLGTAVEAGLPFDSLWKEVRRANMEKKGGKVDASGKLMKPDGWKPPEIARILKEAKHG